MHTANETIEKLYSDILRDERNAKKEREEMSDTRFQDWPFPPQE
jgi:hypothetical protein